MLRIYTIPGSPQTLKIIQYCKPSFVMAKYSASLIRNYIHIQSLVTGRDEYVVLQGDLYLDDVRVVGQQGIEDLNKIIGRGMVTGCTPEQPKCEVDAELSETSSNAIANSTVTKKFNEHDTAIKDLSEKLAIAAGELELIVEGGGVYEKNTQSQLVLTITVRGKEGSVTPDSLKVNGMLIDGQVYTQSVSTTTYFEVEAKVGEVLLTKTVAALFVSPVFLGKVEETTHLTAEIAKGLTKIVTGELGFKFEGDLYNQKVAVFVPKELGEVRSIYDSNSLNYIDSYDKEDLLIDNNPYTGFLLRDATSISQFLQEFV